jgi:hypothetical protein
MAVCGLSQTVIGPGDEDEKRKPSEEALPKNPSAWHAIAPVSRPAEKNRPMKKAYATKSVRMSEAGVLLGSISL